MGVDPLHSPKEFIPGNDSKQLHLNDEPAALLTLLLVHNSIGNVAWEHNDGNFTGIGSVSKPTEVCPLYVHLRFSFEGQAEPKYFNVLKLM